MQTHSFFATAPRGAADLLVEELQSFGALDVREQRGRVNFNGTLEVAYRACLGSRVASRIFLPLGEFDAADEDALYEQTRALLWSEHLGPEQTLATGCTATSSWLTHSHYGALRLKDAIVDSLRDTYNARPNIDVDEPDVRIHVHLLRDAVTVSLDLSGHSLHRRGYRPPKAPAPLKENLAAALLLRAGWPQIAEEGGAFFDPMCGSGTLPIEAALIAADIAPGLMSRRFGFNGWRGHQENIYKKLVAEAHERKRAGLARQLPKIIGYDIDGAAIRLSTAGIEQAGLRGLVHTEKCPLQKAAPPPGVTPGLILTNAPYGERIGTDEQLPRLYRDLGALLHERCTGWRAGVFIADLGLGREIGLKAFARNKFFNGAIECSLLRFDLRKSQERRDADAPKALHPQAEMFANRLRKNLKKMRPWAKRENIACYRLYDADLPEYALAVDVYDQWVHVQEYAPPASVPADKAKGRLRDAMHIIPDVLKMPTENVFLKVRERQRGRKQYEKNADEGRFFTVAEGGLRFAVNFTDYLDTGLFLDHRLTRERIRGLARGKHFLNLFAYTASASVYAADGGALSTTSVDMSHTYLDWAERNFRVNRLSLKDNHLVRADCLQWMRDCRERFDLIFLDPPTFSNSKKMAQTFDVQRDHVELLNEATRLLRPDGLLIFSTNARRFKLADDELPGLSIDDISTATLPTDFARNPRIHRAFEIRKLTP